MNDRIISRKKIIASAERQYRHQRLNTRRYIPNHKVNKSESEFVKQEPTNDQDLSGMFHLDHEDMWFDLEQLVNDQISDIASRWSYIEDDVWGKFLFFERNRRVARAYTRLRITSFIGSECGLNESEIGLNGFDNVHRDMKTEKVKQQIDLGFKVKIDDNGNLYIKRVGKCNIYVSDVKSILNPGYVPSPSSHHHQSAHHANNKVKDCYGKNKLNNVLSRLMRIKVKKKSSTLSVSSPASSTSCFRAVEQNEPLMIFDVNQFQRSIAACHRADTYRTSTSKGNECQSSMYYENFPYSQRLYHHYPSAKLLKHFHRKCIFCIQMGVCEEANQHNILRHPCWIMLIHIVGLQILWSRLGYSPNLYIFQQLTNRENHRFISQRHKQQQQQKIVTEMAMNKKKEEKRKQHTIPAKVTGKCTLQNMKSHFDGDEKYKVKSNYIPKKGHVANNVNGDKSNNKIGQQQEYKSNVGCNKVSTQQRFPPLRNCHSTDDLYYQGYFAKISFQPFVNLTKNCSPTISNTVKVVNSDKRQSMTDINRIENENGQHQTNSKSMTELALSNQADNILIGVRDELIENENHQSKLLSRQSSYKMIEQVNPGQFHDEHLHKQAHKQNFSSGNAKKYCSTLHLVGNEEPSVIEDAKNCANCGKKIISQCKSQYNVSLYSSSGFFSSPTSSSSRLFGSKSNSKYLNKVEIDKIHQQSKLTSSTPSTSVDSCNQSSSIEDQSDKSDSPCHTAAAADKFLLKSIADTVAIGWNNQKPRLFQSRFQRVYQNLIRGTTNRPEFYRMRQMEREFEYRQMMQKRYSSNFDLPSIDHQNDTTSQSNKNETLWTDGSIQKASSYHSLHSTANNVLVNERAGTTK